MAIAPAFLILMATLLAAVAGLVVVVTRGPVSRSRVEKFARRQHLQITVGNGNRVIRYLATTRRWRVAGFLTGIGASQLGAPPGNIIHFDFITIFMGWFLGALVAEARVAHLEYGSVRAASLQPRQPRRYVQRSAWALVPATAAVAALTGVATALVGGTGGAEPDWWRAWWTLVAALAVAGAVRWVQLGVLRRAQPLAAPDLLAADDAMRSRSLHVLCGGGAAMVGFLWLRQLDAIHAAGVSSQVIGAVQTLGVFVIALAGWQVATSAPAPRPTP